MKHITHIFFTLFALNASAFADYTIQETMEHNDAPAQEITIKMKDGRARCDIGAVMSTLSLNGKIQTLMHAQKAVVNLPLGALDAKSKPAQNSARITLEATGRRETINGFDTEEYMHDNPTLKAKSRYWIAKGYPDSVEILRLLDALQSPAAKQFMQAVGAVLPEDFPGLPIRTESESNLMGKSSKVIVTIVSIKKEPIDDSVFVVPSDYRQAGPDGPGGDN
jgi:hypothetical protein